MTPKEADLAARWQIPVICDDIVYRRIVNITRYYRDRSDRKFVEEPSFYRVELESMSAPGRSFSVARVEHVRAKNEDEFRRMLENFYARKMGGTNE